MEYTYRSTTIQKCPMYYGSLSVSIAKDGFELSDKKMCMKLSRELSDKSILMLNDEKALDAVDSFSCGGCVGLVRFGKEQSLDENDKKIYKLLKILPFFVGLSEKDCRIFVENFSLRIFKKDEYIIHEGESAPRFYIILHGSGRISKADCKFVKITNGEVLGETSYLLGLLPTNSVQALEDTYTLSITHEKLKELAAKKTVVKDYLLFVLSHKLRRLIEFSKLNGFSGQFSEFPIHDVLQTLNSAGKTGLLEVHLEGSDIYVLFREGDVVKIDYGPIKGKEAFRLLVKHAKVGTFSFSSGEVDQTLEPISDNFMGILLEAVQNADEST